MDLIFTYKDHSWRAETPTKASQPCTVRKLRPTHQAFVLDLTDQDAAFRVLAARLGHDDDDIVQGEMVNKGDDDADLPALVNLDISEPQSNSFRFCDLEDELKLLVLRATLVSNKPIDNLNPKTGNIETNILQANRFCYIEGRKILFSHNILHFDRFNLFKDALDFGSLSEIDFGNHVRHLSFKMHCGDGMTRDTMGSYLEQCCGRATFIGHNHDGQEPVPMWMAHLEPAYKLSKFYRLWRDNPEVMGKAKIRSLTFIMEGYNEWMLAMHAEEAIQMPGTYDMPCRYYFRSCIGRCLIGPVMGLGTLRRLTLVLPKEFKEAKRLQDDVLKGLNVEKPTQHKEIAVRCVKKWRARMFRKKA